MDHLTLGVFSPSVLLDVATTTGRLAAAGLTVTDVAVPSSPAQFQALARGAYDAVFTSPDNALAYRFLPSNPLGELLDVEVVAGVDRGLGLVLAGRAGFDATERVRGRRLGVDVPNSGFAFVGYALLEELGVHRDDVDVVALGSTPKRAAALNAGDCELSVLNAGNELVARSGGAVLLADVTMLGPYLGTVLARMRQAPGADAVDRLSGVLAETAAAIRTGELSGQAGESAARLLRLGPADAAEHVAVLSDPDRGLVDDATVPASALETLVELRRRFLPVAELDGLTKRFDEMVRSAVLVA